jgi:GWxTD domain-containing protein
MKLRISMMMALVACLATAALAQLSPQSREWREGPVSALLTTDEIQKWNAVRTDADAEAFIDLFWARRDPTPGTAMNEYRVEIERRVAYADQTFQGEKVRGAMTDRGRAFLLYGAPKKAERITPNRNPGLNPSSDMQIDQGNADSAVIWTYEGDDFKPIFGNARAVMRFVDKMNNQEFRLERSRIDMNKAAQAAIARTISQPALTVAPAAAPAAPAPAAAAMPVPVAVPVQTALTTEALTAAVAQLKAAATNPYDKKAYLTWGEYVTSYGEYFVPVGLYVPKASGISGDVTFFGVVEDATGQGVLAFEQPVTLVATKDDFYIDKSLALPAGKHRGVFGLAQNGKVVALVSTDMELAGTLDKDAAGISQLLLSNNIYPLTDSQKANDPYAFGGVRVVPKADKTFRSSDELWYFFELRNPGLADPTAVPVDGTAPVQMPKIQVKLDVEGTDTTGKKVKMSAPPREAEAIAMKGVPGHYGVGNAIPLATFKPGDYNFSVKVIDTIRKTSYTLTDKFKVVQ